MTLGYPIEADDVVELPDDENPRHRVPVVTYRYAYEGGTTTLCARHAESPPYPLGEVAHGSRPGYCDECDRGRRRRAAEQYNRGIAAALKSPAIRRALDQLVGCPEGGRAETHQAMRAVDEELPRKEDRVYTLADLVAAAMVVDGAGRYRWREGR